MTTDAPQKELVIVMPVYNEEACIEQTLAAWTEKLSELKINFQILVLNDGSKDRTGEILNTLTDDRIKVIHKSNSGHGPTILLGYRYAVQTAPWVFQCDSDGEISPGHFQEFWFKKHDRDFVIGVRQQRNQPFIRKFISGIAKLSVNILFMNSLQDVNCPYRLMHSQYLEPALKGIPDNTFAPNVILSGQLLKNHAKILEIPVINEGRKTGAVSLQSFNALKKSALAFWQTLTFRFHH